MNVSSDFYDALDEDVSELLEDAARRAEGNDRKTVPPRDLETAHSLYPSFPISTTGRHARAKSSVTAGRTASQR